MTELEKLKPPGKLKEKFWFELEDDQKTFRKCYIQWSQGKTRSFRRFKIDEIEMLNFQWHLECWKVEVRRIGKSIRFVKIVPTEFFENDNGRWRGE